RNAGNITLTTINDDGTVSTIDTPLTGVPNDAAVSAAFGTDTILIAWSSGGAMVVGYDGSVVQRAVLPASTGGTVITAWDGRDFVVIFSKTAAYRIAAAGSLLDTTPFQVTESHDLTFASNGLTQLALWSESRSSNDDIVGRVIANFDALIDKPAGSLISYSGEARTDVQIAQGPRGT